MLRIAAFIGLVVSVAASLFAQTQAAGTLTGKLTDASGAVVANATVTATNIDNGQTRTATTGADGGYQFTTLPPGNYRVKFEAQGFKTLEIASATIGATRAVVDGKLEAGASTPSLGDLGFTPDQSQGSAQDQARLDKRSHMLKIHQRLGLITTAPLVATLFAANGAAGHKSTASGRDLHAILGGVTAGMYLTTASFAIFAPKIAGTPTRGPIRVHKALAWIHGPGMILTPILGSLALEQRNRGEKVHGIASAHGAVAGVTAAAYGAAMLSVMIKF
ncbi:MAG: carboxypeptidase-like regulatory domain-containing protein [Candidatus Solibacter sp.]|jgi:hypothetical protein